MQPVILTHIHPLSITQHFDLCIVKSDESQPDSGAATIKKTGGTEKPNE